MKTKQVGPVLRTITINDTAVPILRQDDQDWVAIRPICDILGVDYIRAFKNLQTDEDLKSEHRLMKAGDARGHKQNMVCLPEPFIYGWMFELRSKNPKFKTWRKVCYRLMYDAFHGPAVEHGTMVKDLAKLRGEERALEKELAKNKEYIKLQENRNEQRKVKGAINTTVSKAVTEQLGLLFGTEELE